jgi:hypothetical protein
MTKYQENIKAYRDVNFFDLFTYRYNHDIDCYVSECDIAFEDLEQYDDDWYINHIEEKEIINKVLKKANHYMVYAGGVTWNHATGYKICEYPEECFRRNYDFNICLNDVTPGGKVLSATETNHDCMESPVYIIALTDREYNKLVNAESFKTISDFVSMQAEKLEK